MPRQATRASRAILITRPQPGAAESAQALRALGWEPVLAPALTLTALPLKTPPRCQALVITSRAAARALPALPLRVIAVGEATAAEARARGFADVQAAAGDAAALAVLIGATLNPKDGALCLAVGEGYALDLAAALRAKGFRVIRRVDETAPHSVLLVLDATTGQNAVQQVKVFKEMVDVTGLAVTKLDGSAKGGVVVALAQEFGLPVHVVGVGEKAEDLRPFAAKDYARGLMGLD
jgi:hypothetical protein